MTESIQLSAAQTTLTARPRIFCLGPNKSGTKSLHEFFMANGIRSVSMGGPRRSLNIAQSFLRNLSAARPILTGFEWAEAFSDISWIERRYYIDVSVFVDAIVQECPDSYFIYNTRDREAWINSRRKHFGGQFLRDFSRCYNLSHDESVEIWRQYFDRHRTHVETAVTAIRGRLLIFRVDRDPPEKLAAFLAPDYAVDPGLWNPKNVASYSMPLRVKFRRMREKFMW